MNDAGDDTFARLANVVRRTFRLADDVPVVALTSSADIDGWDSLSHAILIMDVEDVFSVTLPLERVFAVQTLGELADLVRVTSERR